MFTRNSAGVGVKNGNIGTVTRIAGSSLTVEVDSKFRTFSVKDYEHLSLGYAVTTHRAQGVTTDNAFLLTNEMMQDRELSYVQVSRARNSTVMFTTAAEAGNDLADLARTMHRSRQKDLASDLLPSFSSQAAAADFGGTQSTSQEASL
jgi:ATP-dependent exoDNAse (exonuclease V) alpha subunit